MKSVIYLPDDWVVKKGETGRHLFIIRVGVVAVMEDETNVIANLYEGSFFGELALLTDTKRTVSVKAIGFCELSTLSKDNFTRLLVDFPSLLVETREIAAQRRNELMKYRIKKDLESATGTVSSLKNVATLRPTSPSSTSTKPLPKVATSEDLLHKFKKEGVPVGVAPELGATLLDDPQVVNQVSPVGGAAGTANPAEVEKIKQRISDIDTKLDALAMQMKAFVKAIQDSR